MMIRKHLSPPFVVSLIALFVALSGTAAAAASCRSRRGRSRQTGRSRGVDRHDLPVEVGGLVVVGIVRAQDRQVVEGGREVGVGLDGGPVPPLGLRARPSVWAIRPRLYSAYSLSPSWSRAWR